MKTSIYEIILKSADAGLKKQLRDGSMPPGHNGPHHHKETPVRNTAYWMITFCKAYDICSQKKFLQGSKNALAYLLNENSRIRNKTFYCRSERGKDQSNGLVGQAWVIDALTFASKIIGSEKALQIANSVYLLHSFNPNSGLWCNYFEENKKIHKTNLTLNQQIFFASVGTKLENPNIDAMIKLFLDKLQSHFKVNSYGIIGHLIFDRYNKNLVGGLRHLASKSVSFAEQTFFPEQSREIGYHPFNLVGLTTLFKKYPNHYFWKNADYKKSLKALLSKNYLTKLDNNIYGYPYNVAGFECAYTVENTLPVNRDLIEYLVHKQLQYFNFNTNLLELNTSDPRVLAARLCELARLKDLKISI